ncbi:hypothetical protein D3C72_1609130 [compost metagenome]
MYQVLINPVKHDIRHLFIANKVITIITIFIELMQINVIKAGAAIKDTVINDEAFKMQNTKRFTSIDGDAVDTHVYAWIFLSHAAVPVCIGV